MTKVFFNNLRLKRGCLYKIGKQSVLAGSYTSLLIKKHKVLAIFVYLHSQSQLFFVDVSFEFSNDHCRCTAYGNFAILLSLMQHVTGYLLTPKDLDFRRFFGHKRPISKKIKTSRTRY